MHVWTSSLELSALPGSEDAGKGAFTHCFVPASEAAEAEQLLRLTLRTLGWRIVEIGEFILLTETMMRIELDENSRHLAAQANATGGPEFTTFHMWAEIETPH